jgi:hypothetical protein
MGFSWNEWHLLRLVSDSGVSTFHQGHRGIDSAFAALERVSNEQLPAEACKDALRRMLEYLKQEGLSS